MLSVLRVALTARHQRAEASSIKEITNKSSQRPQLIQRAVLLVYQSVGRKPAKPARKPVRRCTHTTSSPEQPQFNVGSPMSEARHHYQGRTSRTRLYLYGHPS